MSNRPSPSRLRALAEQFGTPLFVYDLDAVRLRYRTLREALPRQFEVFYAVKANPSLALLRLLAREGAGADVASSGELAAAKAAGFAPRRIVATGPGKSDEFLRQLVELGVAAIHTEGPHEVARIESVARGLRRQARVSLRLNPGWGIAERRRIIGGPGAHKFGMSLPDARRILAGWSERRRVRFEGFLVFNASNVLDAKLLAANASRVMRLAERLTEQRHELRLLDFGGGLGIPYADSESELDLAALSRGLKRLAARAGEKPTLASARLVLEPGRWVVGPAGTYLTRVVEVKRTRGVRHVVVDGGIHHFARPALIGTPHRITALSSSGGRTFPATVGGPLCTSLDLLHPSTELPPQRPGDLLSVQDAGAYGFSESMPLFLSHGWPAEVGLLEGRVHLLRPRLEPGRIVKAQRVPRPLR